MRELGSDTDCDSGFCPSGEGITVRFQRDVAASSDPSGPEEKSMFPSPKNVLKELGRDAFKILSKPFRLNK